MSDSLQHHGLYSLPGSSVRGILQARILEWESIPFSRGSSWPRDQTQVSCIVGRFFSVWATGEAPLDALKKYIYKTQTTSIPWAPLTGREKLINLFQADHRSFYRNLHTIQHHIHPSHNQEIRMGWMSVLWLQLEILFGHNIYSLHFPMCKQEPNLSPKYPLRPIFCMASGLTRSRGNSIWKAR